MKQQQWRQHLKRKKLTARIIRVCCCSSAFYKEDESLSWVRVLMLDGLDHGSPRAYIGQPPPFTWVYAGNRQDPNYTGAGPRRTLAQEVCGNSSPTQKISSSLPPLFFFSPLVEFVYSSRRFSIYIYIYLSSLLAEFVRKL